MPKLNLATASQIKHSSGVVIGLKGPGGILWPAPVGGGAPRIVNQRVTTFSSGGVNNINLPTGMTAGDDKLLLVLQTWEDDPTPVTQIGSSLTLAGEQINAASAQASAQVWWRKIDGTEGSNVQFDHDTGRDTCCLALEIENWDDSIPPTVSFFDSNASAATTFITPEHSWAWDRDTLVLTGFSADNDRDSVSTPTGYTVVEVNNARNWFGCFETEVTTGSPENPEDITVTGGDSTYVGFTIGIAGTPGGPDLTPPVIDITNVAAGDEQLTVEWETDDDEGTARIVVVPNGATAPTATEILAGQASGGGAPSGSSASIAVSATGAQTPVVITGLTNGTAYDVYLAHQDVAGNASTDPDLNHTPAAPPPSTNRVQHFYGTVADTGGNVTLPIAVDLDHAFVLTNGNSKMGAGPDNSSSNLAPNNLGLGMRLTSTTNVALDREPTAGLNNIYSGSVWEYTGSPGGANEFIVRDRRTTVLSSTNSATFTPAGIVNADKCIVFITGNRSDRNNSSNYDHASPGASINRTTGEVLVEGRGSDGTHTIETTVVEFTGSNWTVHYASENSGVTADTGTLTLSGSVSSWANAMIFHNFYKNGGGNGAIADVNAFYEPGGANNEIFWQHDANHDGTAGQRHTVFVLENAGMTVNRYSSAHGTGPLTHDEDITALGLTDLSKCIVQVSAESSGSGSAHGRGHRIIRLLNLTTIQHEAHRTGNNMNVRMQVAQLP